MGGDWAMYRPWRVRLKGLIAELARDQWEELAASCPDCGTASLPEQTPEPTVLIGPRRELALVRTRHFAITVGGFYPIGRPLAAPAAESRYHRGAAKKSYGPGPNATNRPPNNKPRTAPGTAALFLAYGNGTRWS